MQVAPFRSGFIIRDTLLTADVSVEVGPEYFAEIGGLPQVEAIAPASFMFVAPEGVDSDDLLALAAVDERFNVIVDRPLLVEGRRPRAERTDEALINAVAADRLGIGAESVLSLVSFSPAQVEALISGTDPGEPAGPEIDVTVVGVGRTEEDLASGSQIILLTTAFYETYREAVGHFDDILQVRLRGGPRDADAFEVAVSGVVPQSEGAIVEHEARTTLQIEEATSLQAASLLVFAIAAALAE